MLNQVILVADEFGEEQPFLVQRHLQVEGQDFLLLTMVIGDTLAEESILVYASYNDGELELVPVEDDEVIDAVEEILNDL